MDFKRPTLMHSMPSGKHVPTKMDRPELRRGKSVHPKPELRLADAVAVGHA